uniref:Protein kinase domain-containing protein n=1 Tax=Plectus sambesii TaxID=2011161 RepID=A0A914UI41_9BILA
MIEEDSEHFTDDNDGARYYAEPYDKLLNDDNVYEELDPLFQDRLDYEAIGEKYEIKRDQLTIIKLINRGYYSDIHMGMLSLSSGSVTVAVKMPQLYTDTINATEREDTLRRQRRALRDELNIFVHLQSSSAGGHENVLKLIGAITTIKNDFCLLTEYCDRGSMDCFLQTKRGNSKFEDELIYETNRSGEVWKV